jgi:hypothetical protein
MPTLKANFVADWIAYVRQDLVNTQGWPASEIAALDHREVRLRYFDAQRRRIAIAPRILRLADDFICPPDHEVGWKALQEQVLKGQDLNPHLSTGHASLLNSDGLLAEWGVHHFHLGTVPHPKQPLFVSRTESLVYAIVRDELFCAINVYTHKNFEESSILESIHRNWPELISRYRMKAVTGVALTQAERRTIRRKNGNVLTATKDGTVYMPIGGPTSAAGINFEAIKQADACVDRIQVLQDNIEDKLPEFLPLFEQRGFSGEREIEAELKLSDGGVQIFFPKYQMLAAVAFAEEPASSGSR